MTHEVENGRLPGEFEVEITGALCFNDMFGDCDGQVEYCPPLTATLCSFHHAEVHGRHNEPVEQDLSAPTKQFAKQA